MSDDDCSERKIVVANDTKSAKMKTQIEAQRSGFNLEKEEQGSVRMTSFSAVGIKRRRSKADFAQKEKPKLKPSAAGSIWKGGATE